MWNGVFSPKIQKSADPIKGEHRQPNPRIKVGEFVDPNVIEILVQFDHECKWNRWSDWEPAPSNEKEYVYFYNLPYSDTRDSVQEELDEAHEDKKSLRWLHDALKDGRLKSSANDPLNTAAFSVESLL